MQAAERGDPRAQNNLGWLLQNGLGTKKSESAAVTWYRKAAQQGETNAWTNLGYLYLHGYGVPKNTREALKWFEKAAERLDGNAFSNLGLMYETGSGVAQDPVQAYVWYTLAMGQGIDAAKPRAEELRKMLDFDQIDTALRILREWWSKH